MLACGYDNDECSTHDLIRIYFVVKTFKPQKVIDMVKILGLCLWDFNVNDDIKGFFVTMIKEIKQRILFL